MTDEVRHHEAKGRRFELRPYRDGLFEDLYALHSATFKPAVSMSALRAKYDCAPLGRSPCSTIAYEAGVPVAFHGALPYPVRIQGRRSWVGHSCDYITAPQCQRLGLHSQLAQLSLDLMRRQGMVGAFAMFSEVSGAASVKMGWRLIDGLQRFHLPSGGARWGHRVWRAPGLGALYRRHVERQLRPWLTERGALVNPLRNDGVAVDYAADYLSWKRYGGSQMLAIAGATVWVRVAGRIAVGAAQGLDETNLEEVIARLRGIARRCGVSEVMFQVSGGTRLFDVLAQAAPAHSSYAVGILPFNDAFDGILLNYGDFDTY